MRANGHARLPLVSLLVALDAVVLPLVGAGLARAHIVSPMAGFVMAFVGVVPALGGAGLAVLALRRHGHNALAMTALWLGSGFAIVVIALAFVWSGVPRMNDVTTDLENPVKLLAKDGADIPHPERFAVLQREGYADIRPVRFDSEQSVVFQAAVASAAAMGWEVAGADQAEGRMVATATSRVFGFVDDIVVRVHRDGQGTVVDIRSRSRVGVSDLGANAKRIRRFFADLQDRVG